MFSFAPTGKGLLRAEFLDRFGAVCSVQESSFTEDDCVWLGVEVDLHGDEVIGQRMHLTRQMAQELIPILRYFARTGKLGVDVAQQWMSVGSSVRGVHPENMGIEGRIVHVQPGACVVVQNCQVPGPTGEYATRWDAIELYWEPYERPAATSRYRLLADDE